MAGGREACPHGTLEPEQGSPAKRNKMDNDNDNEVAPDGWRALEGDGKVLNVGEVT